MYRTLALSTLALAGCITPAPPAPAPVATPVAAPFDKTWASVIDVFAAQNLPIATIDKASGLLVAQPMSLTSEQGRSWAACSKGIAGSMAVNRVTFNVVVRPVSAGSTIQVNARWEYVSGATMMACNSTGVWEARLQLRVKDAAEGK